MVEMVEMVEKWVFFKFILEFAKFLHFLFALAAYFAIFQHFNVHFLLYPALLIIIHTNVIKLKILYILSNDEVVR